MPLSTFLTLITSRAWASGVRFLWITAMPPSRARQMAVAASLTVSMAAEINGILKVISLVRRVETSHSFGNTSL